MNPTKQRTDLLAATAILNYNEPTIQKLIKKNGWLNMSEHDKIKAIYDFVKDDIVFGYNRDDAVTASEVLNDGYGQCNTKATLLMALLRATGVPCRFHGFTINKRLQKGAITGIWYFAAPKSILHSWVEIWYQNDWRALEGVILDHAYLLKLQNKFGNCSGTFCGYGVYTDTFEKPPIDWDGKSTYIQNLGINQDFGTYNSPDEFYKQHGSNLAGVKRWLFIHIVRKSMNRNICAIRNEKNTKNLPKQC